MSQNIRKYHSVYWTDQPQLIYAATHASLTIEILGRETYLKFTGIEKLPYTSNCMYTQDDLHLSCSKSTFLGVWLYIYLNVVTDSLSICPVKSYAF